MFAFFFKSTLNKKQLIFKFFYTTIKDGIFQKIFVKTLGIEIYNVFTMKDEKGKKGVFSIIVSILIKIKGNL